MPQPSHREEYLQAIGRVIDAAAYSGGPFVEAFEEEFAAFCGSSDAVGVGSGTEALWLAMLALGIGSGDEVITVPTSFVATTEAICFSGAKPVFVDIDELTYTLNPEVLEKALTPKTKAIIPIHLFGQPADMDPIMDFARKHSLYVIEDAAQAHGAEYKGRKVGSIGDAGCFSFYPGKNLGALGEGGAVVTNNSDVAKKIKMLRNHGRISKNQHSIVGWNSRMDGIQAAVLSIKLKRLDLENKRRRYNAKIYKQLLNNIEGIVTPIEYEVSQHVFHIYALRVPFRDKLISAFDAKEILHGIHYPIPIHLQSAYRSLGYDRGDFPIAELCADQFLSIPMSPEMCDYQIKRVCDVVRDVAGRRIHD